MKFLFFISSLSERLVSISSVLRLGKPKRKKYEIKRGEIILVRTPLKKYQVSISDIKILLYIKLPSLIYICI